MDGGLKDFFVLLLELLLEWIIGEALLPEKILLAGAEHLFLEVRPTLVMHTAPLVHMELATHMDLPTHREPSERRHLTLVESTGDGLATLAKAVVYTVLLVVYKGFVVRMDHVA